MLWGDLVKSFRTPLAGLDTTIGSRDGRGADPSPPPGSRGYGNMGAELYGWKEQFAYDHATFQAVNSDFLPCYANLF